MNGKILIKTPHICICVIKIDGIKKVIKKRLIELPIGVHKINVGIEYYSTGDDFKQSSWSAIEWAWKNAKELVIDETVTIIKIKRKWHLFKHITTEATIEQR